MDPENMGLRKLGEDHLTSGKESDEEIIKKSEESINLSFAEQNFQEAASLETLPQKSKLFKKILVWVLSRIGLGIVILLIIIFFLKDAAGKNGPYKTLDQPLSSLSLVDFQTIKNYGNEPGTVYFTALREMEITFKGHLQIYKAKKDGKIYQSPKLLIFKNPFGKKIRDMKVELSKEDIMLIKTKIKK